MGKKGGAGINVGGSSILIIFVLLCLTTFATLSLVSANADYKMTFKTAEAANNYYAADAKGEEKLAEIDACLKKNYIDDKIAYFEACAKSFSEIEGITVNNDETGLSVVYEVPVSESQKLSITVDILFGASEAGRYKIKSWQVINTLDWVPDDSIEIWDGEM